MAMASLKEYKPAMAMITVQSIYAAMAVLAKAVFIKGMSVPVFVFYRQAVATLVLVPTSIIFGRGCMPQVPMAWDGYCLVILASVVGVTMNQYCYYEGLRLANTSVATAMSSLIPAITFVMAASIGLERVRLKSIRSMTKIVGTMICVGGAMCMGLVKGPKLLNTQASTNLSNSLAIIGDQWTLGFLCLLGTTCCWSLWLILQVPICKRHLDPLQLSTWMCFLSTIQTGILAFFLVPDSGAWRITSILELMSCLFVGIFGSGVTFYLQSWTISVRGPLFSSLFTPLCTVITTTVSVPLLHEELHIGSLVGAIGVACGLYLVLWGKAEDLEYESKPEDGPANRRDVERGHHEIDTKEPLLS